MNLVLSTNQFNKRHLYFDEPIQNTIIENSKFIKITYSTELRSHINAKDNSPLTQTIKKFPETNPQPWQRLNLRSASPQTQSLHHTQ